MNHILNFIKNIDSPLIKYSDLYHTFSFHATDDIEIKIKGSGRDIDINFSNRNIVSFCYVSAFEEAKPLMEDLFFRYHSQQVAEQLARHKLGLSDIAEHVAYITGYLKNNDLTKTFKPLNAQHDETYILNLENEKYKYSLNLQNIYTENNPLTPPLDILSFSISIYPDKDNPNIQYHFKHRIPGWELSEYKAFKNILEIDKKVNTLDEFSMHLQNLSPDLSRQFNPYVLSEQLKAGLPVRDFIAKSPKI